MKNKKIGFLVILLLSSQLYSTPQYINRDSFRLYNSSSEDLFVFMEFHNKQTGIFSSIWALEDLKGKVNVFGDIKKSKKIILQSNEGSSVFSISFDSPHFDADDEILRMSFLERFKLVIEKLEVKNDEGLIVMTLDELMEDHFYKVPAPNTDVLVFINNYRRVY